MYSWNERYVKMVLVQETRIRLASVSSVRGNHVILHSN